MVEVGEKGVKNKIIFTDAGINSYSIDKVIAINIDNETELSNTREDIYELESRGIQTKNSKLFKVDTCTNEQYSWESFKGRTDRKNAQDYYGDGNRGKNSKKAKTISFNDDGRQSLIEVIEQGRDDNKQVQVAEQNAEVGVNQTLACSTIKYLRR